LLTFNGSATPDVNHVVVAKNWQKRDKIRNLKIGEPKSWSGKGALPLAADHCCKFDAVSVRFPDIAFNSPHLELRMLTCEVTESGILQICWLDAEKPQRAPAPF
jgi:hypothetical protein